MVLHYNTLFQHVSIPVGILAFKRIPEDDTSGYENMLEQSIVM
jgi:hypothetical protein